MLTTAEIRKKVRELEIRSKKLTQHLFTGEYQNTYNYPDQLLDVCPKLGEYERYEEITARHGIEISAKRVRKVMAHFDAEPEQRCERCEILEPSVFGAE